MTLTEPNSKTRKTKILKVLITIIKDHPVKIKILTGQIKE